MLSFYKNGRLSSRRELVVVSAEVVRALAGS